MKGLVLKTVGITLAFIFAFILITFGVFALFFPKNTAYFFDGLGYDKVAVKYMAKAYDNSKEYADLESLCGYVVKTDDNGLIAEYLGELFTNGKDELSANASKEYYDYLSCKYISSLYSLNSRNVVEVAFSIMNNYSKDCCVHTLVALALLGGDDETLSSVKTQLNDKLSSCLDEERTVILSDIEVIEKYFAK